MYVPSVRRPLIAAAACLTAIAPAAVGVSQTELIVGGDLANFGVLELDDAPHRVRVTTGGRIDVRRLDLGPGCVGFTTRQPDVVVRVRDEAPLVRLFFVGEESGDTAIVTRAADGAFRCNDDFLDRSPQVDLRGASPGRIDVWVTSYHEDSFVRGHLHVTTDAAQGLASR